MLSAMLALHWFITQFSSSFALKAFSIKVLIFVSFEKHIFPVSDDDKSLINTAVIILCVGMFYL